MNAFFARNRPHVFAAALCLGFGAANGVRLSPLLLSLLAMTAGGFALASAQPRRTTAVAVALCLLGWAFASARLEALDDSALVESAGSSGAARVVTTGPARRGTFALRLPAEVIRFRETALQEPVLLELPLGRAPPQGAILDLRASIRLPRASGNGFDERAWLRRRGVQVVLRGAGWRLAGSRAGLAGLGDRLRSRLSSSLSPGIAGERRAVLAGVVLGEDEGLEEELREAFRASGLYHLLAVSGQNVAFLAGGVMLLVWLLRIPRAVGQTAVIVAIATYVLVVGWQPSVVRAGVAGGLASLAWLAARPRDRWYFMLLGACVLLAWNPYSLGEPGFQLSFTAVAAIFVLVPRLERRLEGYPIPKSLATVLALSAACGFVTAPILWLQFGSVPVYSILSNALAAPAMAPLLCVGLVTAALDQVLPSAAATLAWANGWLAAWIASCARLVAGLPFAQASSGAIVLGLLAAPLAFVARNRVPRAQRARLVAPVALFTAIFVGWQAWPEPLRARPSGLRITILDVGQGDSTLLEVPEGAILVDQGPPEARVDEQLQRLGVDRLAVLILSHPSRDNIGGAPRIVARLRIGLLLEPDLPFPNPFGAAALREARRRGVPVAVPRAGKSLRLGRLSLRVLWPPDGERRSDDPNDHATVLLASYGSVDFLLSADAEGNVLTRLGLGRVEIIKVPHHGSSDEHLPRVLETLHPELALISVGARNDYGHPAPSTLAALATAPKLAVYRTDRDGQIVVESDGERIDVRRE